MMVQATTTCLQQPRRFCSLLLLLVLPLMLPQQHLLVSATSSFSSSSSSSWKLPTLSRPRRRTRATRWNRLSACTTTTTTGSRTTAAAALVAPPRAKGNNNNNDNNNNDNNNDNHVVAAECSNTNSHLRSALWILRLHGGAIEQQQGEAADAAAEDADGTAAPTTCPETTHHDQTYNNNNAVSLVDSRVDRLLSFLRARDSDIVALRHGQSRANVAGMIASNPASAVTSFGLSRPRGRNQARAAAETILHKTLNLASSLEYRRVWILSSDFCRARETAEIVQTRLEKELSNGVEWVEPEVRLVPWLRERWFGDYDGTSVKNYQRVWDRDAHEAAVAVDDGTDADHDDDDGTTITPAALTAESVDAVVDRLTQGLLDTLLEYDEDDDGLPALERCLIVCASHGDVLQILQCVLQRRNPRLHRSLTPLETAEVRRLTHFGVLSQQQQQQEPQEGEQ